MTSKVLFLRVGKIEEVSNLNKTITSAINKKNISSSYLTKIGFSDDEQANKKYHGGENKAVLFFSTTTYEKIQQELNTILDYETTSLLGENILVKELNEENVCVGDVYKLGEAIIQVTQPREPCNSLSINSNNPNMLKCVYENGYTGWYAKVLEEGDLKVSDEISLINRVHPKLTISYLNKVIKEPKKFPAEIESIKECSELGTPFKEEILKRFNK